MLEVAGLLRCVSISPDVVSSSRTEPNVVVVALATSGRLPDRSGGHKRLNGCGFAPLFDSSPRIAGFPRQVGVQRRPELVRLSSASDRNSLMEKWIICRYTFGRGAQFGSAPRHRRINLLKAVVAQQGVATVRFSQGLRRIVP